MFSHLNILTFDTCWLF